MSEYDQDLAFALGQVALADAESDEWLVAVLGAIFHGMSQEVVRILVASDSALQKLSKIKKLLDLRGYAHSGVGDPHKPVEEIIKSTRELKERRDLALHSFYAVPDGDEVQRFRSRQASTSTASIRDLGALASEIRATSEQWSSVVRQLEHLAIESRDRSGLAGMILEDCRELLVVQRLDDSRVEVLRAMADASTRIALKGFGRWRPLVGDEEPAPDEHVAVLGPNGRIEVTLSTGETLLGGDTGWRDVTGLAAQEDPAIERSLIRRIHDGVQYVQEGGGRLPIEDGPTEDTLQRRVFARGSGEWGELPAVIRELEGFGPATPKEPSS